MCRARKKLLMAGQADQHGLSARTDRIGACTTRLMTATRNSMLNDEMCGAVIPCGCTTPTTGLLCVSCRPAPSSAL